MLKWLRWKVFGQIIVELEDWNGCKNVRKAKKVGDYCYVAQRYKCLDLYEGLVDACRAHGWSELCHRVAIYPPFLHLPEGPW